MAAEAPNPNAKIRRKPFRLRPKPDEILAALKRSGCFYGPASQLLGISRSNLRKQIQGSSRLSRAVADLNENQLDVLEGTVWDQAVNKRDMKAAAMILNARAKSRGYGLAPGEVLGDPPRHTVLQLEVLPPTGRSFDYATGQIIEHKAIESDRTDDELVVVDVEKPEDDTPDEAA